MRSDARWAYDCGDDRHAVEKAPAKWRLCSTVPRSPWLVITMTSVSEKTYEVNVETFRTPGSFKPTPRPFTTRFLAADDAMALDIVRTVARMWVQRGIPQLPKKAHQIDDWIIAFDAASDALRCRRARAMRP